MDEERYRELCNECDEVLVEQKDHIATISISWLHVLREHPIFLAKYSSKKFITFIFQFLQNFSHLVINLLKSAFQKDYHFFKNSFKQNKTDVVFVSHLLNSQSVDEVDFYFGRLPDEFSSLVLKLNHAKKFSTSKDKNVLILPRLLSFNKELFLLINILNEFLRLLFLSRRFSGNKQVIYRRAAFEVLSPDTMMNLRLYKLLAEFFKETKPKIVITTYEGHAWERMVFAATKVFNGRSIESIGYQHAALFRLQHAIYRSLGQNFDPTFVLCAGSVGFNQMQKRSNLLSRIEGVMGSPRALQKSYVKAISSSKKILVIPEGILGECIDLFTFSMECAKLDPSITFIWRLHPLMSFNKIFSASRALLNRPKNIEISCNNFEDDILNSTFVLYRGSTAVVPAVARGLVPIYLNQKNSFSVNPLFEIIKKCIGVSTPQELIEALSSAKFDQSLTEYCAQFYQPLSSKPLRRIISNHSK